MSAARTPLSNVDTAWRRMDTDVNQMMIVGVWLLQPALKTEALFERVRTHLLRHERFRQKVVVGALGAAWVTDEGFDLRRHVVARRLQRRPGQTQRGALQKLMGKLASTPLNSAHPLWQFHLIQSFEGGSAVICRIHHCIADGIALNAVMMSMADGAVRRPLNLPPNRPPGLALKLVSAGRSMLTKSLRWIEHPRDAVNAAKALARDGAQLVGDVATLALMPNDSPTRLKGHGSGRKVVAWCEPLPLEPVKVVGRALGASVNDVLLSCVAGAIGHDLREQGDDTAGCDIRALVPVNLRPLDEAWQLGNRFGLVPLLLPVGVANPIQRLGMVHARMQALKGSFQPLLSYALLGLSGWLVEPGQKALSKLFLDKTTAVMTNVPGPLQALRIAGSTLRQSIFWVPASGDIGMGVSIISYAGSVQFGLITDGKLCPQPDRIIDRFTHEFEQLLLLCLMLPWDAPDAAPLQQA